MKYYLTLYGFFAYDIIKVINMIYRPKNAKIITRKVERSFTYENTEVLFLDIEYPEITLLNNRQAQYRINLIIISQVKGFITQAAGQMYRNAVENYINAKTQDYPFNIHELVVRYYITLNQDCVLSLYHDKYMYEGGAHGITPRSSNTFDLCAGRMISLASLFPYEKEWKNKVLSEVLRLADENSDLYFENYRELILKNFNPDSFYLTETGVVIYYQQYDIGPYVIGIPVFEIPYDIIGIEPPKCSY